MCLILSHRYPSIFILFYGAFIFSSITAAPVSPVETYYSEFISRLTTHHCTMPKEVSIPFPPNSDPYTFDYLSTPLQACQTVEAKEDKDGAHILCKEIFEVIENITCADYTNKPLPQIISTRLSDVCSGFFDMRDALPKESEFIAWKFADKVVCSLLCVRMYEPLCKTLLWSYDVQIQIRNALESKAKEENSNTNVSGSENDLNMKEQNINNGNIEQEPSISEKNAENTGSSLPVVSIMTPNPTTENKSKSTGINLKDLNDDTLPNSKLSVSDHSVLPVKDSTTVILQKDVGLVPKTNSQSVQGLDGSDSGINEPNIDRDTNELLDLRKNNKENAIEEGEEKENALGKDLLPNNAALNENTSQNNNHITTVINAGKNEKSEKAFVSQAVDMSKDTANNANNAQSDAKLGNSLSPVPSSNEQNNVDVQGQEKENTIKENPADTKNPDVATKSKSPEKTEDAVAVISSVSTSETPDLTTLQIMVEKSDEDQAQEDRDQEQYSKNQPTKDKDSEVKNSISITSEVANLNGIASNYDPFPHPRNNLGSLHDDVQIVPAFPEQEDSHFFFYFLSIVLILMAGYLIFHNKQKIIALIVEGRHERRRRSHGAGYKKLETK